MRTRFGNLSCRNSLSEPFYLLEVANGTAKARRLHFDEVFCGEGKYHQRRIEWPKEGSSKILVSIVTQETEPFRSLVTLPPEVIVPWPGSVALSPQTMAGVT